MALNYFGPVRLTLGLLPGMRERHDGHIVNISTMGTQIGPTPRFSAYLASKAALDQFTASSSQESTGDGVAWSTVYMPLVRTPMIAPTKAYRKVPALSPSEGAELLLEAIVDRPRYVSTPVGTIGHALHTVNPGAVETLVRVFTGTPARS
jgi:short-subunit dehydrogenase